jgi:hypothetical protein
VVPSQRPREKPNNVCAAGGAAGPAHGDAVRVDDVARVGRPVLLVLEPAAGVGLLPAGAVDVMVGAVPVRMVVEVPVAVVVRMVVLRVRAVAEQFLQPAHASVLPEAPLH